MVSEMKVDESKAARDARTERDRMAVKTSKSESDKQDTVAKEKSKQSYQDASPRLPLLSVSLRGTGIFTISLEVALLLR